jgi:fused signal recognition particle receptor
VAAQSWLGRLRSSLHRTGSSIAGVFTGKPIDDDLYEELESALLMADAGMPATQFILQKLKLKVKQAGSKDASEVKALLVEVLTELLRPLERELDISQHQPTVIMVAGVNGAGKTTSIGKLTRHLHDAGASVLLAAADTFRAAAKEQLMVWADRNQVDIISQDQGDPAAVSFDAVTAGKARGRDVVLVDTSRRMPTPPGIFVLHDGMGLVAKRLEHIPNSDPPQVRIVSDNLHYSPYERLVDEMNIVGRIRWFAREM